MPLAAHTRIGPYEILNLLGTGGMGEVYRARDSRLKRDVALKVLPDSVASDQQSLERFEREAQVLASLSHPKIASIYGLEESGNVRALVMEVVEGPTLAEYILRGPMPIEEALGVAHQITEALEYAHERGIVHRDLKPANVKLTPDGGVKILDFGLAKALTGDSWAADISSSPTVTAVATRAGIIVGTPGYMSPEQARGKHVDRRADVWSFGCVLFEMLTRQPAFPGDTVSDVLAAVLTREPEFEKLPPKTPADIRRLLQRCLQKDAKKRLQAIGDARIEIAEAMSGKAGRDAETAAVSLPASRRRGLGLALTLIVVTAVAVATAFYLRKPVPETWSADVLSGPNVAMGARISPDGHTLAFQAMIDGVTQVAVSSPDTGSWNVLTHDRQHGFVNEITWAPDGSKLYYDRTIGVPIGIYSIPAVGGGERLVLANAGTPEALPDGSLLVIRPDTGGRWRIHHYWPESQRIEPLPSWVNIGTNIALRVLPNGKGAVFNGTTSPEKDERWLYFLDMATGKTRRLDAGLPGRNNEGYPIAVTPDSRAVLIEVPSGDLHRIVRIPVDGKGPVQTVMTLTEAPWYLDISGDGTLYLDQVGRPHEILRFPAGGGTPEVLASSDTFVSQGSYMAPVETTDGRFVVDVGFSGKERLVIGKAGGEFVPLLDTTETTSSPAVGLADDEVALVIGEGNNATIGIASAGEGRLVRRLQGTRGKHVTALAASPDSKTLYFASDGHIWSIAVADGVPRQITTGDNVSMFPGGRELLVTRNQWSSPTLVKVSLVDSSEHPVPIEAGQSIAPVPLGPGAINREGKALIAISPADSWFYRIAVVDLASGRVTSVAVTYPGDTLTSNWTPDGHILSVGLPLKSHVWRFRSAGK